MTDEAKPLPEQDTAFPASKGPPAAPVPPQESE